MTEEAEKAQKLYETDPAVIAASKKCTETIRRARAEYAQAELQDRLTTAEVALKNAVREAHQAFANDPGRLAAWMRYQGALLKKST